MLFSFGITLNSVNFHCWSSGGLTSRLIHWQKMLMRAKSGFRYGARLVLKVTPTMNTTYLGMSIVRVWRLGWRKFILERFWSLLGTF